MTGKKSPHECFPPFTGEGARRADEGRFWRENLAAKTALTWLSAILSRKRERRLGITGYEFWHDARGVLA